VGADIWSCCGSFLTSNLRIDFQKRTYARRLRFQQRQRGGLYSFDVKRHLPDQSQLVYGEVLMGANMNEFSLASEAETLVVTELQNAFPDALGIYAFGSRVHGTANAQSDLDLAILVAGYSDPLQLFEMANQLADQLGYEVDLLDLRAASTVMQHQVITTGRRLWAKDMQADLFDVFVLNEKLALDELRAEQLNEIRETGRVYDK